MGPAVQDQGEACSVLGGTRDEGLVGESWTVRGTACSVSEAQRAGGQRRSLQGHERRGGSVERERSGPVCLSKVDAAAREKLPRWEVQPVRIPLGGGGSATE